jgi:RNA polymerase sigma-70 factor (ECF subfamily)
MLGGEAIMTTAAEELWRLVHDGLRAFIARRVADQAQIDDILQDVFLRVHRQIGRLHDPRRIVGWVYQITRHAIIDHYRKTSKQHEISAGVMADMEESVMAAMIPAIDRDRGSKNLRAELAGCLRPMIARLPPAYREAITLVELEGLKQQTAARQLGLSLSGMKSRVQRARRQLKQMLEACCLIQLDRRGGVADFESRDVGCDPCRSMSDD